MYDVIVIGAGNGGLVSALTLQRQGKKVLLLEKNAEVVVEDNRYNNKNIKKYMHSALDYHIDFLYTLVTSS